MSDIYDTPPHIEIPEGEHAFKVWYIPQIPGEPFEFETTSYEMAKAMLATISLFSAFEFEHHVKPDYSDAGGLLLWDPEGGEWEDIHDDEDEDEFLHDLLHEGEVPLRWGEEGVVIGTARRRGDRVDMSVTDPEAIRRLFATSPQMTLREVSIRSDQVNWPSPEVLEH